MGLFSGFGKKKKGGSQQQHQSRSQKRQRLTFRLEEIITPNAPVPLGNEHITDPSLVDLSSLWMPSMSLDTAHTTVSSYPGILGGTTLPLSPDGHIATNASLDAIPFVGCPVGNGPFPDLGNGNPTIPDPSGGVISPPVVLPVDPPVSYHFPKINQPLIGVIDTGFNANNPDIDYSRVTLGRDRVDNDDNPLLADGEGNEHGTHVLGIIGATNDNGIGIDGINDQAPLWLGRAIGSGKWAESLREFVNAAKASGQPHAVVNLSF